MKNSFNITIIHFGINMIKNFGELIKRVNAINLNFSPSRFPYWMYQESPYGGPYYAWEDDDDYSHEIKEFIVYDRIITKLEDYDTYAMFATLTDFMPESFMAALSYNCEASNFHRLDESLPIYWHDWLDENDAYDINPRDESIDPKIAKQCKDKLIKALQNIAKTFVPSIISKINAIKL